MSTDLGPRPSSRRDDPLLSVLVAIGAILGLAWFEHWWGFHVVTHIGTSWPESRLWILQLMAVTGGYVVGGRYYDGDFCSGTIWSFKAGNGRLSVPVQTGHISNLSSFGVDGTNSTFNTGRFLINLKPRQQRPREGVQARVAGPVRAPLVETGGELANRHRRSAPGGEAEAPAGEDAAREDPDPGLEEAGAPVLRWHGLRP